MADRPNLTPEKLRQLLRYEPDSGELFWRERTPDLFMIPTSQSQCDAWNRKHAGQKAFTYLAKHGYLVSNISKLPFYAHRAAWAIYHGVQPSGKLDHINGIRTDNRIINLREVTNAENARNMAISSANTSGVSGVYFHAQTGKWCVQISAYGRKVGLGLFTEKSDAIIARKAAERVLSYHPNHGRPAVSSGKDFS